MSRVIYLDPDNPITHEMYQLGDILVGINGVDRFIVEKVDINDVGIVCEKCSFYNELAGPINNCNSIEFGSCGVYNGCVFKKIDIKPEYTIKSIHIDELKSSVCNENLCIYYSEECDGEGKLCIFKIITENILKQRIP